MQCKVIIAVLLLYNITKLVLLLCISYGKSEESKVMQSLYGIIIITFKKSHSEFAIWSVLCSRCSDHASHAYS